MAVSKLKSGRCEKASLVTLVPQNYSQGVRVGAKGEGKQCRPRHILLKNERVRNSLNKEQIGARFKVDEGGGNLERVKKM